MATHALVLALDEQDEGRRLTSKLVESSHSARGWRSDP